MLLMLAGCTPQPSYPVPDQHRPFDPYGVTGDDFMSGGDLYASRFFVKDIWPGGGPWHWTGAAPELRFRLRSVEHRTLIYDFVVHESTFPSTGPLRVEFFVNGHEITRLTCDRIGDFLVEKPVPSGWLRTGEDTLVLARIENPFRAKDGGVLGFLIKRAGFVE